MKREWSTDSRYAGGRRTQTPKVGSKVLLAGTRRSWTTEGQVVGELRNGWLVVDFPSCCWIGDPAKLEPVDNPGS
jgi:hypothetical protein